MNSPSTSVFPTILRNLFLATFAVFLVTGAFGWLISSGAAAETAASGSSAADHNPFPSSPAPAANQALVAVSPSAATNPASLKAAGKGPAPTYAWFQTHPFKTARVHGAYGWTAENGKDTNVILHLAHNELEYQRMVIENHGVYARQLVYHTEPFTLQAQQAVQSGQTLKQITLPGLDGQELPAMVTRTELKDGGKRGTLYGKLPGDADSIVTVAFIADREAFTVMSPRNQIHLVGEAREPGELVVKSINPATYGRPGN